MNIGTKSVLFGAHQFLIHPWFVAWGWWKLYGFPFDPRLWVAFFVHDLGYIGKPNMDGPEGETHVELGARIMGLLFGAKWENFSRYHSRFYAKRDGVPFSRLCVADKLAISLTPAWLYLPLVNLTGEVHEYMNLADTRNLAGEPRFEPKYASMKTHDDRQAVWYARVQEYCRLWAYEHQDGRDDTWTPAPSNERQVVDQFGTYK